jgi:hypothetical protein
MSTFSPEGLTIPSYTTTQRDALTGLQTGEFIYNSTKQAYEVWSGTFWATISF